MGEADGDSSPAKPANPPNPKKAIPAVSVRNDNTLKMSAVA